MAKMCINIVTDISKDLKKMDDNNTITINRGKEWNSDRAGDTNHFCNYHIFSSYIP
jgi:hypothetical protein